MEDKPYADSYNKFNFGKLEVVLLACIAFQLIICLMPFYYGDGYFRDELYFIALSNHLGWGYVDVPPLSPLILRVFTSLFGDSLTAIHIPSALAGTAVIFISYKMVKILHGKIISLLFAIIPTTFLCCLYGSRFTYDVFDLLFWSLMIYSLLKLKETGNQRWWLSFGIFAGLGLITKVTVLFLGAGIFAGILFTNERKNLKTKHFWYAGLIALVIFLPYLIWNCYYGFPTIKFFANYSHGKVIHRSLVTMINEQLHLLLPVFPVWVLGLYYFLFNSNGKKYRFIGVAFIVLVALCFIKETKPYLTTPFYLVLLAGGGVCIESIGTTGIFRWLKTLYLLFIIAFSLYILPEERPVLPLGKFIEYYGNPSLNIEGHKKGMLPQFYADSFGWKSLAEKTAKIYDSLPPEIRSQTAIITDNYGEAGAIALFGKKYGLPFPLSGHNQYYLWGPGNYTGKYVIWITSRKKSFIEENYEKVKLMGRTDNKYCMPYENDLPIWFCQNPKFKSFKSIWPKLKIYI